jgi:hypothetical protein
MPLNVMDAHYRSFAQLVVLELVKQNIGVGPPAVSVRLKADATVS